MILIRLSKVGLAPPRLDLYWLCMYDEIEIANEDGYAPPSLCCSRKLRQLAVGICIVRKKSNQHKFLCSILTCPDISFSRDQ